MHSAKLDNEKDLLVEVAAGSQASFSKLVDHYKNSIYTSALKVLHSSTVAEEVLQDVLLVLWLKRTFLPQTENFSAYLYGITKRTIYNALRNVIRERLREDKRKQATTLQLHIDTDINLLEKDYSSILQKAISQLPDKQRRAYVLVKMDGLKREDAAKMLNVSPETVKSNLEEAIRKVRAYCYVYVQELTVCLFLLF